MGSGMTVQSKSKTCLIKSSVMIKREATQENRPPVLNVLVKVENDSSKNKSIAGVHKLLRILSKRIC